MAFGNIWMDLRTGSVSKEKFANRLFGFMLCFLVMGGLIACAALIGKTPAEAIFFSMGISLIAAYVCALLAFTGILRFRHGVNEILDELGIEVVE